MKSLQYLLVEYLQRKLFAKVTSSIARAYFLDTDNSQDLERKANRFFDVILIQKNLAFLVTDGVAVLLQTILGICLISFYHPVFIIFGVLILLSFSLPVYLFSKPALHSALGESTSKYRVADYIRGPLAKSEFSESSSFSELDSFISDFLENRAHHFRIVFAQNILYVCLYALMNALLLALGGYLVIRGQLTLGQLVAAEIVVNTILYHFLYAKKYLESFYDMYAAACKLHVFYDFVDKERKITGHDNDTFKALHASKNSSYYNQLDSVRSVYTPSNYKRVAGRFSLGVLIVSSLLFLTPWQQTSRGYGNVTAFDPNDRIQEVTANVSGIIEEWLVQDGQEVKKGDPLVRVIDNDPNYLLRLETGRDAAIAKFDAAREASDTARLDFHRQEKLVTEGLSSRKQFEQAKIKYKKLQAEEATAAANLAKAEIQLSRQQSQVITAPRDGQIMRILKGSGTTNVKTGDALIQFVPKTKQNIVELFLDGNDLPLVFNGRKIRVQFEGWPAVQLTGWPSVAIGSFGGVITNVDPSVSSEGTFRVLVQPDPEDANNWPDQRILRQGTRVTGIVLLDRVSIGYELWRQTNGFPKSMPRPPKPIKKRSKKWF